MKTVFILIFILISCYAFSESTAERLKKAKDRTLIIELPAKNADYIDQLIRKGKQTEADNYEKRHKQVTEALKTSFSKFWTYNEKIVFVPSDSVKAFIGVYPQHYAVMRYGVPSRFLMDKSTINYLAPYDGEAYMSLCLPGDMTATLVCATPKRAALGEFIICMHQFRDAIEVYLTHPELETAYVNSYTEPRGKKPRYETKDLTLLIKRTDINMKNVTEEKISKVYPYKYKIVDESEWTDALANQTKGVACYVLCGVYLSRSVQQDDNHNGNRFDDMPKTEYLGGITAKLVYVASDGHCELATIGKDLVTEMNQFKKQLDKKEKKANQPQKD